MSASLEMMIMVAVGLLALVWAVVASYRSVKKVGGCSSCGSSGDCPAVKNGGELVDLTELSSNDLQNTPCSTPPVA